MKKILFTLITILALSLTTVPAFADSPADLTYTFDSTHTSNQVLCDNNSGTSCTGLSYLLLTYTNLTTFNSNYYLSYKTSANSNNYRIGLNQYAQTDSIYIPNLTYLELNAPSSSIWTDNPTGSISVVLSASNGCPACPTCPEQLDPNRSPIMDDFHNVFINTMLSIIPITAIIFVVWFFIDMLSSLVFGRGK